MYKRITIKNLRLFSNLTIDKLSRVNVLVGENNCGKTCLLEAIFLLVGATNPKLPMVINHLRGLMLQNVSWWNTFFNNLKTDRSIEIKGALDDAPNLETLTIKPYTGLLEKIKTSELGNGFGNQQSSDTSPSRNITGLNLHFQSSTNEEYESSIFIEKKEPVTEYPNDIQALGKRMAIFIPANRNTDYRARFANVQQKKQEDEVFKLLRAIEPSLHDLVLNDVGILMADIGLAERIPINLLALTNSLKSPWQCAMRRTG